MIAPAGTTRRGDEVRAVSLHAGELTARVWTLGALLQDMRLNGTPITIGHPELSAYDDGPLRYFGAVIGPVAGRITGGRGRLAGSKIAMETNEPPNALHSGNAGLHRKVWHIERATEVDAILTCQSPAGVGGLPGNRRFRAHYQLDPQGLTLTLTAETDAPTWVNVTHHGYWAPSGRAGIDDLSLLISASRVLPVDAAKLPDGTVSDVTSTRFDFRAERALQPGDRIDHCYALDKRERPMTEIARLSAKGGPSVTLSATAPGLVVFTCDGVRVPSGHHHGGNLAETRAGLALEPQGWPDAPNQSGFPSITLDPNGIWRRQIRYGVAPT